MSPSIDSFFNKPSQWQEEYHKLREIILDSQPDGKEKLVEELKWGKACYTFEGSNIVLIHGFKQYCALLFPKGVLLKDPNGILVQQTENVQSARQLRFTNLQEIIEREPSIKACVLEAVAVEKAGLKVEMKKTSEFNMPEEFEKALAESLDLKTAFEALTPGRQRGYLLYFSQPKQSKTRVSRIEKYYDSILNGKGLND